MRFWILCITALLFTGCATDQVMTSGFVQKRKYRPGLHITKPHLANARKKAPQLTEVAAINIGEVENGALNNKTIQDHNSATLPSEKFVETLPAVMQPIAEWRIFEVEGQEEQQDPVQDYYEEKKAPISQSGMVGFFSSLGSGISFVCMFAFGTIPFNWVVVLFLLSLLLALVGLVMSIRGLKDGYDFKRRGKVFSFIGLFTSATFLIIDVAILALSLIALLAFFTRI